MQLPNLHNWSQWIPAKHQRWLAVGLAGLLLFGGLYLAVSRTPDKKPPARTTPQQRQVFMPQQLERKFGMVGMSTELEVMQRQNRELQRQLETMQETLKAVKNAVPDTKAIRAEVEKNLREEFKQMIRQQPEKPDKPEKPEETAKPGPKAPARGQVATEDWITDLQKAPSARPGAPAPTARPGEKPPGLDPKQPGQPQPGDIRVIGREKPAAGVQSVKDSRQEKKDAGTYLPSGSIFSGTLLTGMDVTTGEGSRRDPFPVLLRVKKEAILPNRYRADVKECFLVASGWGDLSSERAYIRAERLSCIREDGKALESRVEMYAVGEDGKAGVRGRMVNKTGALLGRALMAGFLEGFSKLFGKSPVMTIQTGPVGKAAKAPFESYLSSDALQSAGLSGAGNAMDRLAKYYIDMAENIYPVIEIEAGRAIDFILLNGVALQLQAKHASLGQD